MSELSEKVLKLTLTYIGPSAPSFLERQTKHHLNGLEFSRVERSHLPELAKWVGVSASLLIDKSDAAELADKIKKL